MVCPQKQPGVLPRTIPQTEAFWSMEPYSKGWHGEGLFHKMGSQQGVGRTNAEDGQEIEIPTDRFRIP